MPILIALLTLILVVHEAFGQTQEALVRQYVTREIAPSDIAVTLTRTCGDRCETYRVSLTADGDVRYEGLRFVTAVGKHSAQISREQAITIVNELLRVKFFDAPAEFVGLDQITLHDGKLTIGTAITMDANPTILALRIGASTKVIRFYSTEPLGLTQIADQVDAAVQIERWIGSGCERPRAPSMPRHPAERQDSEARAH